MNNLHGGVILAGGKGSRLMPFTARTPKPLLTVGGKSPLERSIMALYEANVRNVAITTGYLWEEIEKFVPDSSSKFTDLQLSYYREETPMGTLGMIFKILPLMEENFFVISGDVVFDFSLSEMLEFHKSKNAAVTVSAVRSSHPTEYGTIISEGGIIKSFREKPSWKQVISTKINTGIYILNRRKLENCNRAFKDFSSELFPYLLSEGEIIGCFESDGYWCDMGTPESYHQCNMKLSGGENVIGDYVSICDSSKIKSSVIMDGVKISDGTSIVSSVIGDGTFIGKNCVIENAFIGPYSLICDNARIEKRSVIPQESIIGKGQTISQDEISKIFFTDSGKAELSTADKSRTTRFGRSLDALSKKRPVILFHDGTQEATDIYNVIWESLNFSKRVIKGEKGSYPIASFSAMKKKGISIFLVSEKSPTVTAYVFDEKGLPLSREEQLICEKAVFTPVDMPSSTKEEYFHRDGSFSELYASWKVEKSPSLSATDVCLDNTSSCRLLSRIIKKLGGECDFSSQSEEKDFFSIDEKGTDVFCITKKGKKLSKLDILFIIPQYFPCENVSLPDYAPEGLKEAIQSNGGSFSVYGDEIAGRKKASGVYGYDDGISIALALMIASETSGLSIDEMSENVKSVSFEEKTVYFNGDKSIIFDRLYEKSHDRGGRLRKIFDDGQVSIVPQYGNEFRIFAESTRAETASELILLAEKDVSDADNSCF